LLQQQQQQQQQGRNKDVIEEKKDTTTAQQLYQSMDLPMRTALLAVVAYLTVGVLAYHVWLEQWSIVDAMYFSCVCFSTVGYGDLCPTTTMGKLFTCLFGFTGIALLGAVVATLGSKLVSWEIQAVGRVKQQGKKRLLKIYDLLPKIVHKTKNASSTKEKAKIFEQIKQVENLAKPALSVEAESEQSLSALLANPIRLRKRIGGALIWMSKSLAVVIVGGLIVGTLEGWSLCDSIYYSLVTATTYVLQDCVQKRRLGCWQSLTSIYLSQDWTRRLFSKD
jgi:hypothetical protein